MAVHDLLYFLLPKPAARSRAMGARRQATRLLVLTNGRNPTFTYYLEERIAKSPLKVEVRGLSDPLADISPDGLEVVICRYIRLGQLLWLFRNRKKLSGVNLFIDDDLAATVMQKQGSLLYKAYLMAIGIAPLLFLNRLLTGVWASTRVLAAVFAKDSQTNRIVVLPPFPPVEAFTPLVSMEDNGARLVLAFHATGSHDAEHAFLIPIVREVLKRCEKVDFEVVAEGEPAKLWTEAALPVERFTLRAKQDWSTYLAETARRRIDILLVPLLNSRVNDARSGTKRFDAVRMGAAAVFSVCPAYVLGADAGEILIANNAQTWIETICCLAEDDNLRRRTRDATVNAVKSLLSNTAASFP